MSETESFEAFRSALAERYTIERELGRGGNAVVYLAHDSKHDRQVAIKILPPELAGAVRGERFLREIQIAARLSHAHILPLYDSGEAGGTVYYVMPYVAGESLRDRLKKETRLAVADALAITRDVAAALTFAHGQGVVHRDIKPENILLSHGEALVADFGIARALTSAAEPTVAASLAAGTPAYVSPEQAGGSDAIDARSDVYSLGCVVYEMLAGHPPFTGATAQEVLARHSLDPVPSLRAARAAVPEFVDQAITRALAKQPQDRFASVAEFAHALEATPAGRRSLLRPSVVLPALAMVALVAIGVWRTGWFGPERNPRSLAVLFCSNLSGDSTKEYLGEGVTDEFITALNRVAGLTVPGLSSSRSLKGSPNPAHDAVTLLHVAHVVECTVRTEGPDMRIGVRLLDARGNLLWGETFGGSVGDPLALQDSVARTLVRRVPGITGLDTITTLVRRSTRSPEAYDLYQRGRFAWWRRGAEHMKEAIRYFEQAIATDSTFALAYSGLADAYSLSSEFGYMPAGDATARAEAAALKGVGYDSVLAETRVSLARALHQRGGRRDFPAAEREYQRALALDPRYALGHSWYGFLLGRDWGVRFDQAVRESRLAVALDPRSSALLNNLGVVLTRAGRPADAIEPLRLARDLEPTWAAPLNNLAAAAARLGRYDEAIEQSLAAQRLNPRNPSYPNTLGNLYQLKGLLPEALEAYQDAIALSERPTPLLMGRIGQVHARMGHRTQALEILEQLSQQGSTGEVWVGAAYVHIGLQNNDSAVLALQRADSLSAGIDLASALWAPIARDPRFVSLTRKRGLNP